MPEGFTESGTNIEIIENAIAAHEKARCEGTPVLIPWRWTESASRRSRDGDAGCGCGPVECFG